MSNLDKNLLTLLDMAARCQACVLWGAELVENRRPAVLAVYIDNPQGVNLLQCTAVSQNVRALLRAENRLEANYLIEVSSPGIERKFFSTEQYKSYLGSKVRLHLRQIKLNKLIWEGVLAQCTSDRLILDTIHDGPQTFQFSEIKQARLIRK